MDPLDVPELMRQATQYRIDRHAKLDDPSCFVSKIQIVPTDRPGPATWPKQRLLAISRNAANPVEVVDLPEDRTIVRGDHIEL
jgi:K+ transporter